MINKHTVNYHPSPSQLISRIQPLIFPWTPRGVYLSSIFLGFFPKLVYSIIVVVEKFQVYSVQITGHYICESKNWICSFLLMQPRKTGSQTFIIIPQAEGYCPFFLNSVSWRYFFLNRKGWEKIMELRKLPKLNLQGYWSQALVNSTIFATFTFLVMFCCAII